MVFRSILFASIAGAALATSSLAPAACPAPKQTERRLLQTNQLEPGKTERVYEIVCTDAPVVETAEVAEPTQWYGLPIVLSDAGAVVLLATGISQPALAYGSLGLYLLAGPIVHFVHGHVARGVGSLGLRMGLPIVGGTIGYALTTRSRPSEDPFMWSDPGLPWLAFGAFMGAIFAMVGDSLVLAREPVRPASAGLHVTPTFALGRESTAGLAGTF